MTKMTSAYANKTLRMLEEKKQYLLDKESQGKTYVVTDGDEPVVPDYDYPKVKKEIEEIDLKVMGIKHAINVSNSTNKIKIRDTLYTIDEVLVRMAQLNKRVYILNSMRKTQEKRRLNTHFGAANKVTEYEYANYDIKEANRDYEDMSLLISEMQLGLDEYNNTVQFEVDI